MKFSTLMFTLITATASVAYPSQKDIPAIVQETLPSVVSLIVRSGDYKNSDLDSIIESDRLEKFISPQFRNPRMGELEISKCSGIILTRKGLLVTNAHCAEPDDNISIITSDGRVFSGYLIRSEPKIDLALVQITDTTARFKPIKIGSSKSVQRGESVIAIGNPLGFANCVTMGIVSNKNIKLGLHSYEDFIQTDAAINPGNSGGALLNMRGELIGINGAVINSSQSMGFSIPSRMLVRLLEEESLNGRMRYGWFGMKIRKVRISEMNDRCLDGRPRVIIEGLVHKSPSVNKLRNGDVIISIGGDEIFDMEDMYNAGLYNSPGSATRIVFMRDCNIMGVNVIPIEQPKIKKKTGPELWPGPQR